MLQSVKELMGSPGAASYALYSLAVLLFVDSISYTLWPLLLREAWTTIGVIQDLLFITGKSAALRLDEDAGLTVASRMLSFTEGVSKREEDGAEEGGEKGGVGKRRPAFGPARRPPPVLFSVGLVMEVWDVTITVPCREVLQRGKDVICQNTACAGGSWCDASLRARRGQEEAGLAFGCGPGVVHQLPAGESDADPEARGA